MLRLFLRNTAAGYFLKMIQMGLGLIAIPVLVSELGPDGYGLILLAGAVLGYFSVFDLGISNAVTKFVAQYEAVGDRDEVDRVIGTSLAAFVAIGLALASAVLILLRFEVLNVFNIPQTLRAQAALVFELTAFLAILAWPRLALEGTLRGLQEFVSLSLVNAFGRIVSVAIAIGLAWGEFPLSAVYLAMHIDIFIAIVVLPILIRRRLPGWTPRLCHVKRKTLVTIWSFSAWLVLSKIAILLEYQLDTLIIGLALPVGAITAYVVLTYPFRIVQQFSGLAAQAAMPAVSSAESAKNESALAFFRLRGAQLHNAFLAVITCTVLLVLEPFLRLWMGTDWLEQIWIAYLATGFQVIWQSNAFIGQVYTGLGFTKKPGIVAIFTGTVNVILSVILVHEIGVSGVILGTVIGGICGVALFVIWCLPDIGITSQAYLQDILIGGQGPVWLTWLFLLLGMQVSGIMVESWHSLFMISLLSLLILLMSAIFWVLNRKERLEMLRYIQR